MTGGMKLRITIPGNVGSDSGTFDHIRRIDHIIVTLFYHIVIDLSINNIYSHGCYSTRTEEEAHQEG